MQGRGMSAECLRVVKTLDRRKELRAEHARPMVRRLWESYAADLAELLDAYNNDEIDQKFLQTQMPSLVRAMDNLREDGSLAKALEKAQVILIDRVLDGIEN